MRRYFRKLKEEYELTKDPDLFDKLAQFRNNPESVESVMKFYGFSRSAEKPGYWVKNNIWVRHKNAVRWSRESPDLRKRVKDEIGRLLRTNPERYKSLLQSYSVSKDPEEAVLFANEYLREHGLEPQNEIAHMNVGDYCMSKSSWWRNLADRGRIWSWIWGRANFRHINGEEAILAIKDPTVPFHRGLEPETIRLLFPNMPTELRPVIDAALRAGYAYLAFYA